MLDLFSIYFAGPLPTAPLGNKNLLVCAKHLSGRTIACPTLTVMASKVINVVEEHIIRPLGRPCLFVSDNGPCITTTFLEKVMEGNSIKLKKFLVFAAMFKGRAERLVGTVKRWIGKMVHTRPLNWDLAVPNVLYEYCSGNLAVGFSPYERMYEIVPHMSMEYSFFRYCGDSNVDHRAAKTIAFSTFRASYMVTIKILCSSVDPS